MTEKKYDRDMRFVFKTLVFSALIVVGLKLLIDPNMLSGLDGKETKERIKAFQEKIISIPPRDVATKIRGAKGKPIFLMAYASWCGVCRKNMPLVIEALKEQPEFHTLFLSFDRQPQAMARYLVVEKYDNAFTPYLITQGSPNIDRVLAEFGSWFKFSIPYFALFDQEGKLIAQDSGFMDKDSLLQFFARLKP